MSVYYVHAPESGLVKIGFAKHPASRLSKMQVDSPTRLVLLAVESGTISLEGQRHDQFAALRHRGEWFRNDGALAEHIASLPPFVRQTRKRQLSGALGAWLIANGHTLASFAKVVGTKRSTLHAACNGTVPRRELMLRIVEATDWQIDANALCGIPPKPTAAEIAA